MIFTSAEAIDSPVNAQIGFMIDQAPVTFTAIRMRGQYPIAYLKGLTSAVMSSALS